MIRNFYVYIMTNKRNGTLYVGVTNDVARRAEEHRQGGIGGFTRDHGLRYLAWYEHHDAFETAMRREKRLKKWERRWKLDLIEQLNPDWRDLSHWIAGTELEDCPPIPDDLGRDSSGQHE